MEHNTLRTIGASVVLAALVVAGVSQASSGRDTSPVDIETPDVSTTHGDTTATSDAPAPFTYRIGVLSAVTTDNFWAFYGEEPSVWNSYVLGPTKPALHTADNDGGGLVPELARSSVEPEQDGRGWFVVVEMSPEHSWSDGTPVIAEDLVFTFETARELSLGGSWAGAFPDAVESMRARGSHRLEIRFSERPQLSVWPHGVGTAPVMPAHVWSDSTAGTADELYAQSGEHDVSGGPLAIREIGDDMVVSTRNPGYPRGDTPDIVEYHVYPDEGTAVSALIAGDIDYILSPKGLAPEQMRRVGSAPDIEVVSSPGNSIRYLGFNMEKAPMSDLSFRRALATLLDRQQLAGSVAPPVAPAYSILPAGNTRWIESDSVEATAADDEAALSDRLAAAVKLLQDAGYSWDTPPEVTENGLTPGTGLSREGHPVAPLTILTPGDAYDPARPQYARAIAAALIGLGFDVEPVETDFDTVVDMTFSRDESGHLQYDMYLLGWTLGDPSLPGYYDALFSADGAMNNTGYASEPFESANEAFNSAFTIDDARDALWEMERVLRDDLPYLPLYTSPILEAYRSDSVRYDMPPSLGGLQGRLGGIGGVQPAS